MAHHVIALDRKVTQKLDRIMAGENVGSITSHECTAILDRLDKTGISVSLAALPRACKELHPRAAAKHIALRRKTTIKRDEDQTARLAEHAEHHVSM